MRLAIAFPKVYEELPSLLKHRPLAESSLNRHDWYAGSSVDISTSLISFKYRVIAHGIREVFEDLTTSVLAAADHVHASGRHNGTACAQLCGQPSNGESGVEFHVVVQVLFEDAVALTRLLFEDRDGKETDVAAFIANHAAPF